MRCTGRLGAPATNPGRPASCRPSTTESAAAASPRRPATGGLPATLTGGPDGRAERRPAADRRAVRRRRCCRCRRSFTDTGGHRRHRGTDYRRRRSGLSRATWSERVQVDVPVGARCPSAPSCDATGRPPHAASRGPRPGGRRGRRPAHRRTRSCGQVIAGAARACSRLSCWRSACPSSSAGAGPRAADRAPRRWFAGRSAARRRRPAVNDLAGSSASNACPCARHSGRTGPRTVPLCEQLVCPPVLERETIARTDGDPYRSRYRRRSCRHRRR